MNLAIRAVTLKPAPWPQSRAGEDWSRFRRQSDRRVVATWVVGQQNEHLGVGERRSELP